MSERARKKLGRSGSQTSTESDMSPTEPLPSADGQFTEKATENKPAPPRPPPPGGSRPQPGPPEQVGRSSFFDTLEWQESSAPMLDLSDSDEDGEVQHHRIRNESVEDGFADLTSQRVNSSENKAKEQPAKDANFFDAFPEDSNQETKEQPGTETIDLLNMSGSQSTGLTEQVDLLDIGGPEPSNFELLGGSMPDPMTASTSSNQGQADLLGGGASTFDPFQDLASQSRPVRQSPTVENQGTFDPFQQAEPQGAPAPSTQQGSNFDDFDIFQSNPPSAAASSDLFGMMSGSASQTSASSSSTKDLMGDWGSASVNLGVPQASMPRNNSGPNLSAGMHHLNSGSNLAGGMARTGSGQNLSKGPTQNTDPFGDLGEPTFQFWTLLSEKFKLVSFIVS